MRYILSIIFVINILALNIKLYSQSIIINEVQSTNANTIFDEDNESSDWIELFNNGNSDINLNGYSISDDKNNLNKWIFPNITIKSNSYLLLFASDKDRKNPIGSWKTIINKGDNWKYKIFNTEPPANWKNSEYNDSNWNNGPSGFGYGDNDDSTNVPSTLSLYLRKTFTIDDINSIKDAFLHVDYDDGFIAYLNGIEITRQNMGNSGEFFGYNRGALSAVEANMYSGGTPYAFELNELISLLQQGENILAIQVHNNNSNSSDLTLIPFFTVGYNYTSQDSNSTSNLLNLNLAYLHTNFKISSTGESLFLADNNNLLLDSANIPSLATDISFGRNPDSLQSWLFFDTPTPKKMNSLFGYTGFTPTPAISSDGGVYQNSLNILVTNNDLIEKVYYTTDGSIPDTSSLLYTSSIPIDNTTVLRFKGYSFGNLPSEVVTNTYIINENITMPIISISTNPENLWDEETGIYVLGNDYDPAFPYFGANFWEDWEKTAHFEIFETDQITKYESNAGIKIHGNWSRALDQKSLAFFARGEYGNKEFEYKLFPNRSFSKYNNFILRNSGQDFSSTMFRDLLMQNLVGDLDLDLMAGRPAIVFLNGEYWGIHNIREKLNEDMIAAHHNLLPDEINLLENNANIVEGTNEKYQQLITYITNNNLSNNNYYTVVKNLMQVDNFVDYELANIYYANNDWPGNNIKYWTSQSDTSRWRWLMFDTDFGFGLYDENAHKLNSLTFALEPNGPNWPNPPWSTLLLRRLLQNTQFKNEFINRFADLSNSIFRKDVVLAKIDSLKNLYAREINRHISKYGTFNFSQWTNNVNYLRSFANSRVQFLRLYFIQYFGLESTSIVNLNVNDKQQGKIKINRLIVDSYPWNGVYFKNIPILVTAVPKNGYKFVRWEGKINSDSISVTINPDGIDSLTAVFASDSSYGTIVINEINYNSAASFDTDDWVEFYNSSQKPINISGWIFKDEDDSHSFTFPNNTIIQPDDYLVLCADTALVFNKFPDVTKLIGNMSFGLSSSGELVRLYDVSMNLIDSLTYDDKSPWPTRPDGNGASLSLINPSLDNALPSSWKASIGHGTPETINDIYTNVESEVVVESFYLSQNYPNPFNPTTNIAFSIPIGSVVKIDVYNILGEHITTLCNEFLNAGNYIKEFNGSKLSSGVYIYRLTANNFTQVKKMTLLK